MPCALIFGITGQDGSYLAELLLEKGYEVHGTLRRQSSIAGTWRIDPIFDRLHLYHCDVTDGAAVMRLVADVRPDEVYNLAAQSHVGVSFETPDYTANVDALGTLRLLEAVRCVRPQARVYQASTSEMFGNSPSPQNETTPFKPRSPYACAKVYAHHTACNYREAYGLHVSCGILFNHECVTAKTPVLIRHNGLIDIVPIEDLVPHRTQPRHGTKYTTEVGAADSLEVWDREGWTRVTCMTATWNGGRARKVVHRVAARGAVIQATADHVGFVLQDGKPLECKLGEIESGEQIVLVELPPAVDELEVTEPEAWLLGLLVADGHVTEEGRITVTNQDEDLLRQAERCWRQVAGGTTSRYFAQSGFPGGRLVTQLRLHGDRAYGRWLREALYTRDGDKRVPRRVLNAVHDARLAFLRGFNAGDGLKSTPCTYEFQGFKTVSAVLAQGLYWLTSATLHQRMIICLNEQNDHVYYQLNLNSPDTPGKKGQHLRRPLDEVVKAQPIEYTGWLFDFATTSGTFHAGIGQAWIHNSPRRGETFVTRKIARAALSIAQGKSQRLSLGSTEAMRDWGWAPEYVYAMWLMLQQDKPDDYVVATGRSYTVADFCEAAFARVKLDWRDLVDVCTPRLLRPLEVPHLEGNAQKAWKRLGWRAHFTGLEVARMMVDEERGSGVV